VTENPGTDKVENLLMCVDSGSYVIPFFQRGFEWQASMVADLIESILENYYVGLLLFWELNPEQARNEKWDPVWGAQLKGSPQMAILDGQQRLASLYYALYNPRKTFPNRKTYYLFYLDLKKIINGDSEESIKYRFFYSYQTWNSIRINRADWIKTSLIPLAILSAKDPSDPKLRYIDSTEFNDWLGEYVETYKSELPKGTTTLKIYRIFTQILNYPFVYYPLSSNRELPDICNIFAKVNAKGMKLSTFDLMNAFLYPKGIKLRKEMWEEMNNSQLKEIDSNMNEYLLKLISLIKQNYCSSRYIYNLIPDKKTLRKDETGKKYEEILVKNGEEFRLLWKNACQYAEKARQLIMHTGDGDFGAVKSDFIPNTTIVPVLGAILWEYKGDIDKVSFKSNLKKWYWSAVLSEDYSGSSDSVMAKDFRDWKEWIHNATPIERTNRINDQLINEMDLNSFKKGSSRYNAILCLLSLNGVKDFYKGRVVGLGDFAKEKINDHHIFPKQAKGLDVGTCSKFKEHQDSIVNRTLLLDETNGNIRAKRPSQYTKELIQKHGSETKVRSLLEGHLINEACFNCLMKDDFNQFLVERERAIKQHILDRLK